jgi:hypothetical protein
MGVKSSGSNSSNGVRIRNKTRQLEKRIRKLEKCREKPVEARPGKPLAIRRPLEHIKRDCRIGRKAEGFVKEEFKFKAKKVKTHE